MENELKIYNLWRLCNAFYLRSTVMKFVTKTYSQLQQQLVCFFLTTAIIEVLRRLSELSHQFHQYMWKRLWKSWVPVQVIFLWGLIRQLIKCYAFDIAAERCISSSDRQLLKSSGYQAHWDFWRINEPGYITSFIFSVIILSLSYFQGKEFPSLISL